MTTHVYILSGCRTAIGSFQGQFDKIPATELGSVVIKEAINRAGITAKDVDQVIMGQVLTAGQGQNPARQASVGAQVSYNVPAYTVNMLCGSGLKAVSLGFQAIRNQDNEIVVAGGQESMTRAQHAAYTRGVKLGPVQYNDTLFQDGLTDAFHNIPMGNTAEHLAKEHKITRPAQDVYALMSQSRTQKSIEMGLFVEEIVPVVDKKSGTLLDEDEFPRFNTTLDGLAKLRPAFDPNGTVTAGNASGINDGAAALVLASSTVVKARNLIPMARIVGFAEVGIEPLCMGISPIAAIKKVLQKVGWNKSDVDLFEVNEAFAAQSIIVAKTLSLEIDKVNVTGGAIALGHPIGASGARVLVTLLHNLQRSGKKKGVAALCIGGGMGIAMAIEMC